MVKFKGNGEDVSDRVSELARPTDYIGEVDSDVCVIVPDGAKEFGEMISESIQNENVDYDVVSLESVINKK